MSEANLVVSLACSAVWLFLHCLSEWYNYRFVFDLSLLEKVTYTWTFTCRKTVCSLVKSLEEKCERIVFLGLLLWTVPPSPFHLIDS